ncbi:MAG: histidine phosphatase family protein [Burkholderiales bacterium]|nr:histidine phosphatase family protein [Anaerolineae bacterium]
MAKRLIHLVRHGQHDRSVSDTNGPGGGLTKLGQEQAKLVAQVLAPLPDATIHCSTLARTVETASIIGNSVASVGFHRSFELSEVIPVIPAADAALFKKQFPDYTPERIADDQQQAESAFERHFLQQYEGERHRILVLHGNILRYFICRALDVPPDAWTNMEIYNCGISRVMIEESGRMRLISHNDIGHLPPSLRTPI